MVGEVGQRLGPLPRVAEPQRAGRGQQEPFVEQRLARRGEVGLERDVTGQAAAEGVGHPEPALPGRLDQAGHAAGPGVAQLERVGVAILHTAEHDVDGLQAGEGPEPGPAAAHRQVGSFDQVVPEVAGEVGVLEVARVTDAGREDHGPRARSVGRGQAGQRRPQVVEPARQPLDPQLAVDVGEQPAEHLAVDQRVARAPGRIGVVAQHHEAARGLPDDVGRGHGEPGSHRGRPADARPPEAGAGEHHLGGHHALPEEALRAVEVSQEGLQESGALGEATLQGGPVALGPQQGHGVDLPRPALVPAVVVDDVARSLGAEEAVGQAAAIVELGGTQPVEDLDEPSPVLPGSTMLVGQLVEADPVGPVGGQRGRVGHLRQEPELAGTGRK